LGKKEEDYVAVTSTLPAYEKTTKRSRPDWRDRYLAQR